MQKPLMYIHDITTLFSLLDDQLDKQGKEGRPSILTDSEVLTILLWNTFVLRKKHLKEMYHFVRYYHSSEFPKMPCYKNFVLHSHRLIPKLTSLLEASLKEGSIQIVDSTMIPVCKLERARFHKVAKGVATFGKNHQGWHYGFKFHATINDKGQLCSFYFTPASFYDAQALPHLIRGEVRMMVGDGTYNASVMRNKLWETYKVYILAPPHPKQKKKILSKWQYKLLRGRTKIEAMFDYLKNHLNLVTSFPRSISGYFLNYLRNLLAYQMMVGGVS